MNLDKAVVAVQADGTLYPWETRRYQEAKIAILHRHLYSTSIGKDADDTAQNLLTLVTPQTSSSSSSRSGLRRSGSQMTTSTLSGGSCASGLSTLPRRSPSTFDLAAVVSSPDTWGHFVDVASPSSSAATTTTTTATTAQIPYRHFMRRELQFSGPFQHTTC
jgi:hypothetical protein